jgi:hypothetical protein
LVKIINLEFFGKLVVFALKTTNGNLGVYKTTSFLISSASRKVLAFPTLIFQFVALQSCTHGSQGC